MANEKLVAAVKREIAHERLDRGGAVELTDDEFARDILAALAAAIRDDPAAREVTCLDEMCDYLEGKTPTPGP